MGLRSSAECRSNKKGRRTDPQRKRTSVRDGASEPHRLSRSRRKIPDRNHSKDNTLSRTVPSDFPHKSRFRIDGHRISYLRVSITDRCNERCNYCMPRELQEWLPRDEILSYEETLRLIRIAADLGVTKVRVTGGEPLTRRNVVDFVREIPKIPGIMSLGISTNGTLLTHEATPGQTMATALREAGVQSLNISLDTLDRHLYSQITGRDLHARVLEGIEAAIAAGFDQIKLNA